MEPPILMTRELEKVDEGSRSRVSGVEASILSQASLGNGSKRLLLSSHNDDKNKKNMGEFVISYNFDHYEKSKAVTQNIFIGWDDELTTNKVKKNRVPNNTKSFQSKTPLRNRMALAERPILEDEEQNEIDLFETQRNGTSHSLSKLGTGNKNYQPVHLSERKENPFQTISRENYTNSFEKNNKIRNINLKELQNNQSKSSFEKNFVRGIPNSMQNTVRKENRPSMVDERHNKNLRPKDFSSHLDNRVKLPSFDNPKTNSNNYEKCEPFKRGKTIDQRNTNNKEHKFIVDDYKNKRINEKISETSIGPKEKCAEKKQNKVNTSEGIRQDENVEGEKDSEYEEETKKLIEELEKMEMREGESEERMNRGYKNVDENNLKSKQVNEESILVKTDTFSKEKESLFNAVSTKDKSISKLSHHKPIGETYPNAKVQEKPEIVKELENAKRKDHLEKDWQQKNKNNRNQEKNSEEKKKREEKSHHQTKSKFQNISKPQTEKEKNDDKTNKYENEKEERQQKTTMKQTKANLSNEYELKDNTNHRIENDGKGLRKETKEKSDLTKKRNKNENEEHRKGNTSENLQDEFGNGKYSCEVLWNSNNKSNIQNENLKQKDENDESNKIGKTLGLNESKLQNKQNEFIDNKSQEKESSELKQEAFKPAEQYPEKQRKSEIKTVTKEQRISAIVVELKEEDNDDEKNLTEAEKYVKLTNEQGHLSESESLNNDNEYRDMNVGSPDKKVKQLENLRSNKFNNSSNVHGTKSNSTKANENKRFEENNKSIVKNSKRENMAKTNKSNDTINKKIKENRKEENIGNGIKSRKESEVSDEKRVLRSRGGNSELHSVNSESRVSNLSNVSNGNDKKVGLKKETKNHNKKEHQTINKLAKHTETKIEKHRAKKSSENFSEFNEQSSDSDEQDIQKLSNSSAPREITCISKKSSRMSNSSLLSSKLMKENSVRPETKASGRSDSRQSGVRPIVVKEYESIGIQNDGQNIEVKKKKQSQSSIRSSIQKPELNNQNRLSQRKSDKNSLNMKQRDSKIDGKKPIKKISETSHMKSIDNLVSFGNITCEPQLEPNEKESFLDIGSNMKLNQTDIPEFTQRRLNKHAVRNNPRDRNQYDRAPILSFIYGEEKERLLSEIESFEKSYEYCPFTFDHEILDECEGVLGKALQIILEIDAWLLDRIVEPYTSVDGDNQIWLYCKGSWKSFQSNNAVSSYCFLKEIIMRAMAEEFGEKDPQKMHIEDILKMITGLMVMKLKNKKKLSHELEYHLKKNHLIKGVSYSASSPTYNITGVETTAKMDKLIQICKNNEISSEDSNEKDRNVMWIKEETFEKYFDYFVLVCYRDDSFWTSRMLNGYDLSMALVYTFDSICNSNVALEFHSDSPISFRMDLYREVKPKLLKFIGSLNEKGKKLQEGLNLPPSFHFLMRGRYYLMISFSEVPQDVTSPMRISLESTSEIGIKYLESIENMTLKNSNSEYIEINTKQLNRSVMRDKETIKSQMNESFDKGSLKKQFIEYLMGSEDN